MSDPPMVDIAGLLIRQEFALVKEGIGPDDPQEGDRALIEWAVSVAGDRFDDHDLRDYHLVPAAPGPAGGSAVSAPSRFAANLVPIDGGFRVKTTEHGHLDVMEKMFGNWRLVVTDLHTGQITRPGWCYTVADSPVGGAFMTAVLAALAWDGSPDTEPVGWYKEVGSGRRRPGGDPKREFVSE